VSGVEASALFIYLFNIKLVQQYTRKEKEKKLFSKSNRFLNALVDGGVTT